MEQPRELLVGVGRDNLAALATFKHPGLDISSMLCSKDK